MKMPRQVGYGLAMLFMALAATAAYQGIENLLDAYGSLRHTFRTVSTAQDMRTDLLEIRGDYLGYLLNGNAHFLVSIGALRNHLNESQGLLRTLTVDNPAQHNRIDAVGPLIDQRLTRLARLARVRKDRGLPAVLLEMGQTTTRDITAEILSLLVAIENDERNLLNTREQAVELTAQRATRIILYGTLSCFAVLAFLGITTRLSIARRLGEFQQLVTSVKEGDLTHKSARESSDEMGQLARGMTATTSRQTQFALKTIF